MAPFAEPTPPFLSGSACAERMQVSEAEVRRLIRTGVLRTRYGFLVQPGAV